MFELWLFTSTHCIGCEPMKLKCDQVSIDTGIPLKIYNIDNDDDMELAKRYYVMSTPTLMIVKNGEIVDQIIGNVSLITIEEAVNGI